MRFRHLFLLVLAIWLGRQPAAARPAYEPWELAIVIAAPSSQAGPEFQAAVETMERLGQDPHMQGVKIWTLFFDRPEDLALLNLVQITAEQAPCVSLVHLDLDNFPDQTLWVTPALTPDSRDQVEWLAYLWATSVGRADPLPEKESAALPAGQSLVGRTLKSPNGEYMAGFQSPDGNLVIYRMVPTWHPIWASHTHAPEGTCDLGSDGVLRINASTGKLIWSSHVPGPLAPYELRLQDDGNLVIYVMLPDEDGKEGQPVWASNSAGRE